MAACEAIKKAKPDMACLAVGSKDDWADVFVLDTIMMELAALNIMLNSLGRG